jgi:hypothetical protein
MRTNGVVLMDTPLPDGRIFVPAGTANSKPTVVTSALGVAGVAIAAGAAATYDFMLGSLMLRYGMQDDAQQQFGMGNPVNGNQGAQALATPPNQFTTPYGPTGRPPFSAASFGQPVLNRPKGLKPIALHAVYSVAGVALTSVAVSLVKTAFAQGVAPAVTTLINAITAGNPTAVSTMNIGTVAVPVANQQFLIDPYDVLAARIVITSPAGSTGVFYGFYVDTQFNFN